MQRIGRFAFIFLLLFVVATLVSSRPAFWNAVKLVTTATVITGILGLLLKAIIEKFVLKDIPHAEVELLFGNLRVISGALAAVGILVMLAGWKDHRYPGKQSSVSLRGSCWIGGVQGICLPFRGFSRSGATISMGLLLGITKRRVEEFSFALAVVLTPPVIVREVLRLLRAQHSSAFNAHNMVALFSPSLLGMVLSFISGILVLQWLSSWLECGRWYLFGIYCLCVSAFVFFLYRGGL